MFGRKKKTPTSADTTPDTAPAQAEPGPEIHLHTGQSQPGDSQPDDRELRALLDALNAEYTKILRGETQNPTPAVECFMRLPRWYYTMQSTHAMEQGNLPHPPVMHIEGKDWLAICSTEERARRFAHHFKIYAKQDPPTAGIVSVDRETVIRLAANPRLHGVIFDHAVDGGVNTLPGNLPGLYEIATGKVLDDFVVTPGPGEFEHLVQQSRVDPSDPSAISFTRIVERFLRSPTVIILAERDPEGHRIAKVGVQGNELSVVVFAEPFSASATLQKHPSEAIQWPMGTFIQWCKRLMEPGDVSVTTMLGTGQGIIPLPLRAILTAWDENPSYAVMQDTYHGQAAKPATP